MPLATAVAHGLALQAISTEEDLAFYFPQLVFKVEQLGLSCIPLQKELPTGGNILCPTDLQNVLQTVTHQTFD